MGAGTPSKAYPLYDGHGNMLATIEKTQGSLSNQRTYDIWGGVRAQNGISTNPSERHVGNLGHKADDESGLIYMRARYYDPGTGRFVTEDPARDGSNWFVYCNNDPVNMVDVTGLSAISALLIGAINAAAFAVGFGLAYYFLTRYYESQFPGYKGGRFGWAWAAGQMLVSVLNGILIDSQITKVAAEDFGSLWVKFLHSLKQTGWARYSLAAGVGFWIGVLMGTLAVVVEFLSSDY